MSYARQLALPQTEPVSLSDAKTFSRILSSDTTQDSLITAMIQAARETCEQYTGRALAQRQFSLVLDSHPYYTDTIASQQAYPPSYYSLPRYSTTLWNYSQMIKLPFPPLKSVDSMRYIKPDGTVATLNQDLDFVVDRKTELARIFPIPGSFWPPDQYVADSVEIFFTAGYDPSPTASPDKHYAGAALTNVEVTGNVLTVLVPNDFTAGKSVSFQNVATATFLNGQTVVLITATPTQITAAFTHADYPSTADTGIVSPSPVNQQPDSTIVLAVPQSIRVAIMMLVAQWYNQREPVSSLNMREVPFSVQNLLNAFMVVDFAPTRG